MARNQSIEQLRAAQRNGRRHDRNFGVTQACLRELRKSSRTVRWLSRKTGYPPQAVKNAMHQLAHQNGGVTSLLTGRGTERIYSIYSPPVRNVDPDDFRVAAPIRVGRGSRWYAELV